MIQLHIFTIFTFKRDIRLFPSMSIQIVVYFYAPDRPSAQMKCDYAIANVRDFWSWWLHWWFLVVMVMVVMVITKKPLFVIYLDKQSCHPFRCIVISGVTVYHADGVY